MAAPPALPSATFTWANVPNMTSCGPATVRWTYTGPQQELAISAYPSSNLSLLVDAALQNYTIPAVRLAPGEYIMTVAGEGEQSGDIVIHRRHAPFTVQGSDTSCLERHISPRDETTSSGSSSKKAAMFGGIAVGIGGFFALLTAGFYFRWGAICKRLQKKKDKDSRDLPTRYEGQWDNIPSQNTSIAGSVSDHHLLPPPTVAIAEMRMSSSSQTTLPRLEPNRRPPSTFPGLGAEPLAPPRRLEPNRRKPSLANVRDDTAAPTFELLYSSTSPVPKVDLEAEFKPIPRPPPPIPAPILLSTPKPPRRHTARQSATSAFTSASTTLSEMPLLKPGVRTPAQIEMQRALALMKLDSVMDRPPPVPPRPPLPTATPPPPSPTVSSIATIRRSATPPPSPTGTATKFSARARPPSPTMTAAPRASTHARSAPTSPSVRSPTDPRVQALQVLASKSSGSLSRSGSTRTNGSSRPRRKPVPPLDPSDAASVGVSEMWSPRRSSFDSTRTWTGRGSPVPSSSTSQMYRIRESAWSEWTWTRPMEDWEREQLKVLASVITAESESEGARMGMPVPGSPPEGRGAGVGVVPVSPPVPMSKAMRSLRHQSFGEMKAMRTVVPDAPRN
ncbi:hypothetical protein C8Q74DRAFT_1371216 [Fomes fomentarius]|nr:hypothetical protein C8Q74DRAFT_1371216 [Fomes fomentarius]